MFSLKFLIRRPVAMLHEFMEFGASGGMVLMGATVLALAVANSPLSEAYFSWLHSYLGPLSILHWTNDGLMAIFFLLVGLEIKHELIQGELASWQQRLLPGLGALAGMLVPALVYVAFTWNDAELLRGWAIPAATDIAFALGILSLLGDRVPSSLKIFLTALAILDDLGAVLVIALFYGGDMSWTYLGLAVLTTAALIGLNRANVRVLPIYAGLGLLLWVFVLRSGIHATIAGVILAFTVPLTVPLKDEKTDDSPLHRLENHLDRFVPFVVVPFFAFANAGVSFQDFDVSALGSPLTLGVGLGLLLGKVVGICGVTFVLVRMGRASLPEESTWPQFIGLSFLCGVGFTMSLFVGMLAFAEGPNLQEASKIGILLGSLCSGLAGAIILHLSTRRRLPA